MQLYRQQLSWSAAISRTALANEPNTMDIHFKNRIVARGSCYFARQHARRRRATLYSTELWRYAEFLAKSGPSGYNYSTQTSSNLLLLLHTPAVEGWLGCARRLSARAAASADLALLR